MQFLEEPNPQRQKAEWWVRAGEGVVMGEFFNGCRVSVWEDEKVLEMDGVDGCTMT